MSINLTRKKINFLVIISSLIIIIIWITWVIIYKPYTPTIDSNENDEQFFTDTNQATNDIKVNMAESQKQWEVLQKYLTDQINQNINTSSTSSTTSTTTDIK